MRLAENIHRIKRGSEHNPPEPGVQHEVDNEISIAIIAILTREAHGHVSGVHMGQYMNWSRN